MKKAKEKVKVLLDGQGGDEVFGGYFSRQLYLTSHLKDMNLKKILGKFRQYSMFLSKDKMHSLSNWLFPKFYNKLIFSQISNNYKIFNEELRNSIKKSGAYIDALPPKKFRNYINNLSYHFITNMTIPTLLHYEDRSSMAHSIESRVPFLDYRLVEFGTNLPPEHLVYNDISRPLFRKSVEPYLPEEIVKRRDKLGYPVPFAEWTRGPIKNYVTDILLNENSPLFNFFDRPNLKTNLDMHLEGKIDYSWDIWKLLALNNFINLYRNLTIVY